MQTSSPTESFGRFSARVASTVDAALRGWLDRRIARAAALHGDVGAVAGAIADLTLRGGKRLRPILTAVAYEAFAPGESFERIAPSLVALELLQSYLLTHDDWMDGDALRRGGASVHTALAERFGTAEAGAHAGILAGDLASAYATEALLETDVPPPALVEALREFAEMHHRVVLGQTLDVRSVCRESSEIERMHDLKTGSYTVRGPLRLGAALAGAPAAAREKLDAFAAPLGVAFQLSDDLLGAFGDERLTGKPAGSDFREGKRTAVVAALEAEGAAWAKRLQGAPALSAGDLGRLIEDAKRSGVRARVEARIDALEGAATAAVDALAVSEVGRHRLRAAAQVLIRREH